jgi:hypothetical protein
MNFFSFKTLLKDTFMETFTLKIGNVSITYSDLSLIKVVQDVSTFTATVPFPKNLLASVNNPVSSL